MLIVERGADYLVGLEADRPAMLRDVKQLFAQPPGAPPDHGTLSANHSRVETQRHQAWQGVEWLTPTRSEADSVPLAGLAMVGMIETTVEHVGSQRCNRRCHVSSRPRSHGPGNLTTLRKLALNVLRSARPDISIRPKRKQFGWTDELAKTVLGQMR